MNSGNIIENSNLIKPNEMNRLDGLLAIGFYFFNILILFLFGLVMFRTDLYSRFNVFENANLNLLVFYIPISLVTIFPIIIILYLRKQSLASLGIKKSKTVKSIFLGILFALPFTLPTLIYGIYNQYNVANMGDLIWRFFYFLFCIGFVEELAFRGFIQTRIRGIIKNQRLSIIVVGVMFGVMHIPFQMLLANMSPIQFVLYDIKHLMITMLVHGYLVFIYSRDNNIVAPTITHTLMDLIGNVFVG